MAIDRSAEGNHLKEDPDLKRMLADLDTINSQKSFRMWKVSFLERFEQYLDASTVSKAETNYNKFTISMGKTSRLVKKLYGFLQTGELTPPDSETGEGGRVTVKARKGLTDLHSHIDELMEHLTGMLPATQAEEKELGYTKYHLGAVLIRDGFVEYDRLVICDEILQHMRWEALQLVADRVLLDQMEYYHDRLQMFCDVMADLGLLGAMKRCRQLLYLEEDGDTEEEDRSENHYVPPAPLPTIANGGDPTSSSRYPGDEALAMKAEPTKDAKGLPSRVAAVGAAPSTPKAEKKATRKKPKSPGSSPNAGLYARRTNDDDSDSDDAKSRSSSSDASKDSEYTETSYFNTQPVWEQKKGENSQAYFNLNSYYHGNPTDFLIGRKMRNKSEEKKDDPADVAQRSSQKDAKAESKEAAAKKKESAPSRTAEKDSMKEVAKHKKETSSKKPDHKKEKKQDRKTEKEHKSKDSKKKKKLKPLPASYPPPPPTTSKDAQDCSDGEDEHAASFLPSTIGGSPRSTRGVELNQDEDDVEELGMESAHGTAVMNHSKKQKSLEKPRSEKRSKKGAAQWGAVLGPTDKQTGRPEIHRRMSIASLDPKDDDGDGSVLPETSLLAPTKQSLGAHKALADEDEEADTIPLTPSQIKAQQKNHRGFRNFSISDTSTRESKPTASSRTKQDNDAPKSPTRKKAEATAVNHQKTDDLGLGSSNPAQHVSSRRFPASENNIDNGKNDHSHRRQLLPTKSDEGSRDFGVPRRTSSGLKDYSRYVSGEDDKPGLKDYSKREGRTVNLSNSFNGSDSDMTKDKQSLVNSEIMSLASSDMVRKPKKALKISMSTKEPKIKNMVSDVPRSPERKDRKDKSHKKTKNEKRPVPLSEEEKVLMRKKCYMWYARMGQPDRENMKRRVAALPAHCNIYPEDVDLLPWSGYGAVLSIKAMNELFMGDDAE